MLRLTDLREILRACRSSARRCSSSLSTALVVEDDNFANILLDIALAARLRIGVAAVHKAGIRSASSRAVARHRQHRRHRRDGRGHHQARDDRAAACRTHPRRAVVDRPAARAATPWSRIRRHPPRRRSPAHGQVERVDIALLQARARGRRHPVIPPLGCDGEGHVSAQLGRGGGQWRRRAGRQADLPRRPRRHPHVSPRSAAPAERTSSRIAERRAAAAVSVDEADVILEASRRRCRR